MKKHDAPDNRPSGGSQDAEARTIEAAEAFVLRLTEQQQKLTQAVLAVGDQLVEIKQLLGADWISAMAEHAGISPEAAQDFWYVASRIPPDHPLRAANLGFAHLRVIAKDPKGLKGLPMGDEEFSQKVEDLVVGALDRATRGEQR
jgi:hypothetical protein